MHNPDRDEHNQEPTKDQDKDQAKVEKKDMNEHDEDLLDESLKETFPASDPPSTY